MKSLIMPALVALMTPTGALAGEREIIRAFEENDYAAFVRLYEQVDDKSSTVTKDGLPFVYLAYSFYVDDPRFFERVLLEADPNAEGVGGFTAMYEIRLRCDAERAKALVERGADVNHSADGALTPLHIVANSDCYELAEYLLAAGANPRATTAQGETPADIARRKGDRRMADILSAE